MYKVYPKFKPDEVLVYLRKSRADDPSLEVEEILMRHETILREWIERNLDGPVPEENYYREVVSGETIAGRPEVKKLLKRMESPKIKAVLCVEVQRISRGDLEDCGRIIKLFRYTHTYFITPHKIYDIDDEYDRDGFERELKRGNEYLEYAKKIMRRGIVLSKQSGSFLGATDPYGYRKTKVTIGKKKCPTLEVIEDEARVVRMIFDWYANEGIGSFLICERLNEMGIKPRIADKWQKSTITKMIDNELYIGKIRSGVRSVEHRVIDQEIVKRNKYNTEYELHDGIHDAIVDEELFYKAKERKGSLTKHKPGTELRNPFASILRCKCGAYMEIKYHRQKWRFVCVNQTHCRNSSVYLDDIMPLVIEYLNKSIDDFTMKLENEDDGAYDKHNEYIALLESKLSEAEEKEIAIWEKYSEEGMPKSVFEKLRIKCEKEKEVVKAALAKAYNSIPEKTNYEEVIFSLHNAIDMLQSDSATPAMVNKVLKTVVEKIECSRPMSFRLSPEEAKEQGVETCNGWYSPDFELDIHLLI